VSCWLNGTLLPADDARIDPADRGYTLGDGVFETVRLAGGQPAQLHRHLRRLRHGAALLEIPLPWSDETLATAFVATAAANGAEDGVARLTLSRGPAPRGVLPPALSRPTTLITAGAMPAIPRDVRAILCTVTRRNEASPLSRIKSLNYLDGVLARMEADRRDADDALLLNTRGMIAEASSANVVVLDRGRLMTPPVTDGALPGTMRELLIERCDMIETPLRPEILFRAEAVFLSNSLGLRAVTSLDGRYLGTRDDVMAELERRVMV